MATPSANGGDEIAEVTNLAARIQPETADLHRMIQDGQTGTEIMGMLWPESGS
ncbi:hypothetical protein [Streptomyces xiamenensis]|uniref:hypothetical protein n=1 Tax=Streptomyces xiamenensis TaxID=408015 RepID=UPI003D7613E6